MFVCSYSFVWLESYLTVGCKRRNYNLQVEGIIHMRLKFRKAIVFLNLELLPLRISWQKRVPRIPTWLTPFFFLQSVAVRKRVDPHLLPCLMMGSFYVRLQRCGEKRLVASWCLSVLSVCLHGTTSLPLDGLNEVWYRGFFIKFVDQIKIFVKSRK